MERNISTHSNGEFINFCFNTILGREPDEGGAKAYLAALDGKALTREQVLLQFISSEEFKLRKPGNLEFFPPGHYYSAIPSLEDRQTYLGLTTQVDEIPGIILNIDKQFELLKRFKDYYADCPFPAQKSGNLRYYFENPSYSYGDALVLYSMIRECKPRRIIEIGSGFSSCVMLDTNELFFDDRIYLTFIEPFPELLHSLIKPRDNKYPILSTKLQKIDLDIFNSLESGDILFVDSTHVSKLGSDVNRIVFEILPKLNSGVLVHFHDIFWPFEYPPDWIKKGIAWNEAYILRAFLEFNDTFEIVLFSSLLYKLHADWFIDNMPLFQKNGGGNIWLKKTLT